MDKVSGGASLDGLKSDFALLDDWEDRYRHVIDLGRELPVLAEADHTPANKVRGCASQVWLVSRRSGPADNPVVEFYGDSDALIVKGLIAIAFMIYSGQTARAILATDAGPVLDELGLSSHLTQQRSNGFAAMIQRIKADARAALHDSPGAWIAGR
ncbi:MAG: SufE family protein [Rhizobiales bacterium]|nr:SufE family protein [Hyphomicrobiales bacterium]MBI3673714.1 SufE family protein [Hyphomicrobiales bacterium]